MFLLPLLNLIKDGAFAELLFVMNLRNIRDIVFTLNKRCKPNSSLRKQKPCHRTTAAGHVIKEWYFGFH